MKRAILALLLGGLVLAATANGVGSAEAHPATAPPSEHTAPEASGHAGGDGGHGEGGGHQSPVTPVLLGLVIILIAAKLGGELAERFHQPAVLGELVAGVVLGNLVLVGYGGLAFLGTNEGIAIFFSRKAPLSRQPPET